MKLENDTAQGQRMAFLEHLVRMDRPNTFQSPVPDQSAESNELILSAGALILDGVAACDDVCAALFEIAVAEPAAILSASVDHYLDWLAGELFDKCINCGGAFVAAA